MIRIYLLKKLIFVIEKGTKKVNEGVKLKTPREEDVFKCLNLKFRPPEERDF